jgi:hypothetical protein
MDPVTYRSPSLLHWFGAESRRERADARRKGKRLLGSSGQTIAGQLKDAASAAMSLGRGATNELALRQASEEAYVLGADAFERIGLGARSRVPYAKVKEIVALGSDRYELTHASGRLVVRPVAHLVRGRSRVPVGWVRNGVEVPFSTLIDELSARCGVEVSQP